jgi:AcrR family transcriptional regulator
MTTKAIPTRSDGAASDGAAGNGDAVVERVASRAVAKRSAAYKDEVCRLLDAGLEVMRRCGTASRPRVTDIVAAAGLSNEAFYRYFVSKDALVAAILEDGTERLGSYVAHAMEGEATPEGKVRRWVEGVLSQAADDDIASTTLAVLWNAGSLGSDLTSGPPFATGPLATLLRQPFADLGSPDPDLDASLAAHATVGMLADWLWKRVRPTRAEIDRVVAFCLAGRA